MFAQFSQPKIGAKHAFFSEFKKSLGDITSRYSTMPLENCVPLFLRDINQCLSEFRAQHKLWDEAMFSSAFAKYLAAHLSNKQTSGYANIEALVSGILNSIHCGGDKLKGFYENNEYRFNFEFICNYRIISWSHPLFDYNIDKLKAGLTDNNFFNTFFGVPGRAPLDAPLAILYWVRLLAELSVIKSEDEQYYWPNLAEVKQLLSKVLHYPSNRKLFLTFFEQERELLKKLLANGKYSYDSTYDSEHTFQATYASTYTLIENVASTSPAAAATALPPAILQAPSPPKHPSFNLQHIFFSNFKSKLAALDQSTRLSSNRTEKFLDEVNKYLLDCRITHAAKWNEAMFSSAFCKYLANQAQKKPHVLLLLPLHAIRVWIHPLDMHDRFNEYFLTFFELCQYRRRTLINIDTNRKSCFENLKTSLTSTEFNQFFFKEAKSNILCLLYWIRLLAELSVIKIGENAPWPSIDQFKELLFAITQKTEIQALLLNFFNQEKKELMILLETNPAYRTLRPLPPLPLFSQNTTTANALTPPLANSHYHETLTLPAAAARAPTPPPQSTKPTLIPVAAPRTNIPAALAARQGPPVAAKSAAAVQAARLLASKKLSD